MNRESVLWFCEAVRNCPDTKSVEFVNAVHSVVSTFPSSPSLSRRRIKQRQQNLIQQELYDESERFGQLMGCQWILEHKY